LWAASYFKEQMETRQTNLQENLPQINLENLRSFQVGANDSALQINIPRTNFNIINIDSIEVKQIAPPKPVQIEKEVKPAISQKDSLKLNLIGKKTAFTNWDLSVEHDVNNFDETIFSQIDYRLLSPTEQTDLPLIATDVPTIDFATDSAEIAKTYTELLDVDESQHYPEISLLQNNNIFLSLVFVSVLIVGFVRINWKGYINDVVKSTFFPVAEKKMAGNNVSNVHPASILNFLFLL